MSSSTRPSPFGYHGRRLPSVRARLLTGALALAAAATISLTGGGPRQVLADTCGENSGDKCWENQSCFTLLFYKQCTTKYKYYPEKVQPAEDLA